MRTLEGKVAVVAGASRGMGRGIAVELGAAGALVYVTGRTLRSGPGVLSSLEDTVADIEQEGGLGVAVECDHRDDDQAAALFRRIDEEQGRLDVLVNSIFNSPAMRPTIGKPFWELPLRAWAEFVDGGTRTAYVNCVAAAPLMLRTAPGGLIVNVSARGAQRYKYNVAYGVGKAALDKMTSDMAEDLRAHGIAVVSIWPLTIMSERMKVDLELAKATYGDLGQLQTPRYSGRAVVALAADPELMARTGQKFWVAELARDYGFTDLDGQVRPVPDLYGSLEPIGSQHHPGTDRT